MRGGGGGGGEDSTTALVVLVAACCCSDLRGVAVCDVACVVCVVRGGIGGIC